MIIKDGVEYRNLVEQVRKNKEDIANHYNISRVLADFGITIRGRLDSVEDLPDPATYQGEYGDGYAIGALGTEYIYYIWTRANPEIGEFSPYWLNIGPLNIVGPQGPIGPIGPQGNPGERGNRWTSNSRTPEAGFNTISGDQWLDTNTGNIYEYNGTSWSLKGNIKGPQGIQGPQGRQGDAGPVGPQGPQGAQGIPSPIVDIIAKLNNTDQLPDPSTVPSNAGYLIPDSEGELHLYIIINNIWEDTGIFGGGSKVIVSGSYVESFNADTKLDKVTSTISGSWMRVYIINYDGTQSTTYVVPEAKPYYIPRYNSEGILHSANPVSKTGSEPVATKNYCDANFLFYNPNLSGVAVISGNGIIRALNFTPNPRSLSNAGMLLALDGNGRVQSWFPNADFQVPVIQQLLYRSTYLTNGWPTIEPSLFTSVLAEQLAYYKPLLPVIYYSGVITTPGTSTEIGSSTVLIGTPVGFSKAVKDGVEHQYLFISYPGSGVRPMVNPDEGYITCIVRYDYNGATQRVTADIAQEFTTPYKPT